MKGRGERPTQSLLEWASTIQRDFKGVLSPSLQVQSTKPTAKKKKKKKKKQKTWYHSAVVWIRAAEPLTDHLKPRCGQRKDQGPSDRWKREPLVGRPIQEDVMARVMKVVTVAS